MEHEHGVTTFKANRQITNLDFDMKIFIIGKQIGLKPQDVREKFLNAASLLESLNLEPVVPSFTDDPESGTFAQRLGQEVETLAGCDGVLMLDNWRQSRMRILNAQSPGNWESR